MAEHTGDADFDQILEKCFEILRTKSIDYAEDGDRLAEIRATAEVNGLTMRQVLGVYMHKHIRSVYKWIRGDDLLGEPITDKLTDVIIYCMLAHKLSVEETGGDVEPPNDISCNTSMGERCGETKSPFGWRCTRVVGHEGPCAAVRVASDPYFKEYRGLPRDIEVFNGSDFPDDFLSDDWRYR